MVGVVSPSTQVLSRFNKLTSYGISTVSWYQSKGPILSKRPLLSPSSFVYKIDWFGNPDVMIRVIFLLDDAAAIMLYRFFQKYMTYNNIII